MHRALVLCLAACAANSASAPPVDPFPAACAATTCAADTSITTAGELAALIDASAYTWRAPYTTGCLAVSDDVAVHGTVTVDGAGLAVPAACSFGCPPAVMFRIDGAFGVECIGPEPRFLDTLCAAIVIHDVTVRLRPLVLDTHPDGTARAVVDVLPPCAASCPAEQFACEATHTCYATVRDHCAYCEAGTNEACACWNGTDFQPDGAKCQFNSSGDVIETGTCRAGSCVAP